jgi:hypothetical protein
MTSALAEVVEAYAGTGKLLVQKWREYGSELATELEPGYDTETASAYLGTGVSLTIETWARLMLKGLEAIEILNMKRRMAWSQGLTTRHRGAKLELEGDLKGAFHRTLAAKEVIFDPPELGTEDSAFKVGIDVTRRRNAVYTGTVIAKPRSGRARPEKIPFQIKYP